VAARRGDQVNERSLRYPGWRVVLACFVMATVCWGFGFYGHAFYLAELQRLRGWPTSLISGATTLYYLLSALLVVFINDAIRRFGIRPSVLLGTVCFALSAGALPFVVEPWQVYALYLVMALGWATMSVGAITNILGLWFDAKRGLAISLALNGASFSGVTVVPGLVFLANATDFATAMLVGAGAILVLLMPLLWVLLRGSPPVSPALRGVSTASAQAPSTWTRARALRSPVFWSISGAFSLSLMSQAGFLVHLIAFLDPLVGRVQAGTAMAVTTGMAIVGRLTLGTVSNLINQRVAAAVSLASQAAALVAMMVVTDATPLLAACAVYGFSVGNLITFPALIVQREFEAASFGMLIGLSTAITQFTYAFGPGLLGLVRDATGGYGAVLGVCIALNLIAAAILMRRGAGAELAQNG
jgi:predicted MFS family arabinose efflux permease